MKWPFITRELIVAAQRRLAAAVALYILLLAGFTLTWGLTAPGLTGGTIYDALRMFEWGALTVLMPWVAARCHAPDRGQSLAILSTLTAHRPSSIVIAKIASLAGVLLVVVAAGMPPAVLAQKMSAQPLSTVFRDLGSFAGYAFLASAVTMAWLLASGDEVTSWIGAAATTAVVRTVTSNLPIASQVTAMIAIAGCVAAAAATWSDRSLQYCDE
ncbi:MAG TPA: hypothetical protein VLV86_26330 [Vicinamibacterales bacterium]|nr:hypothetical protein [Vicinamibacterales bacterium]